MGQSRRLDIAVIGCGIGGLAAAAFLARSGHRVTAFERAPTPGPKGAGILIQPIGAAVLQRLGVLEEVATVAARVTRLHGVAHTGRTVLELSYADLRADVHGLGVHRGVVFGALERAARDAGATIRVGTTVTSVDHERGTVDAADGSHGPFDLVVVADGARSALRAAVFPWARERAYAYGALWFVGEDPSGAMQSTLAQTYRDTRTMVGLMPTGRAQTGGPPLISLFWGIRMDRVDALRDRGIEAWRDDVVRIRPDAAPIVAQVGSIDSLIAAGYTDAWVRPCHRGRVVIIGDAAHAMSPQLGQGANIALVDAMVLAERLERTGSVEVASREFDRARAPHWAFYSRVTRWITPMFQSDHQVLAPVRDLGLPAARRMGWSRRQLVLTLCGLKRGVRRSDPIPE